MTDARVIGGLTVGVEETKRGEGGLSKRCLSCVDTTRFLWLCLRWYIYFFLSYLALKRCWGVERDGWMDGWGILVR